MRDPRLKATSCRPHRATGYRLQATAFWSLIIAAVACIGGCSDIGAIRRDLESPEWQVRCAAAGNLKSLPANEDTTALIMKTLDDPAPPVREAGANTLAQVFNDDAAKLVFDRARDASDNTKLAVIAAIRKRGPSPAAAPFLVSMLGTQPAGIRLAATKALHGSGDPAAKAALLDVWARDDDPALRVAALTSASYPAKQARSDPRILQCYREIVQKQPALLNNPKIIRAAGDLRVSEASPRLVKLITHPELKYVAIESLGKMRSKEAVPALLDLLLKNESWVMNRQICLALGRIRPKEAAPVLARYFLESKPKDDKDSWDRTLFITRAMMKIGGDDIFEAFASQITDKDRRDFAIYALVRMTGTTVIWAENYWLYSWPQIERFWREWWQENKERVAAKLEKEAQEE